MHDDDDADFPARSDRIAGCLLAGAAGDALGAPVEFMTLEHIRRIHGPAGVRDHTRAYGRVGAITDDTQMTLFTAEGLLRARARREELGGADPRVVVWRAYLRWLVTQGDDVPSHLLGRTTGLLQLDALHLARAPGNTCLSALRTGVMGTRRQRLNDSKGCGGVMRAAPAGLVGDDDPFALGADLAAITHSHPTGYLAAGYLAALVDRLVAGASLEEAVAAALERLAAEPDHEETADAVRTAVERAARDRPAGADPGAGGGAESAAAGPDAAAAGPSPEAVEALGGGWVAEEALAIALYCALCHPSDLEAALILAANHSGDTDSTAAICGNILGAALGRAAIPGRWLDRLELRAEIETLARDLAVGYEPTEAWRRKYPPE